MYPKSSQIIMIISRRLNLMWLLFWNYDCAKLIQQLLETWENNLISFSKRTVEGTYPPTFTDVKYISMYIKLLATFGFNLHSDITEDELNNTVT